MTYPDCYEPAEHRRALGKVLDDLKAVTQAEAETDLACIDQHTPETIPDSRPDPVVQVRDTCPDGATMASEPVN